MSGAVTQSSFNTNVDYFDWGKSNALSRAGTVHFEKAKELNALFKESVQENSQYIGKPEDVMHSDALIDLSARTLAEFQQIPVMTPEKSKELSTFFKAASVAQGKLIAQVEDKIQTNPGSKQLPMVRIIREVFAKSALLMQLDYALHGAEVTKRPLSGDIPHKYNILRSDFVELTPGINFAKVFNDRTKTNLNELVDKIAHLDDPELVEQLIDIYKGLSAYPRRDLPGGQQAFWDLFNGQVMTKDRLKDLLSILSEKHKYDPVLNEKIKAAIA